MKLYNAASTGCGGVKGLEKNSRFVTTGQFRCPQKGEYFLSGAIPEAYLAFADMSVKYYILRKVTVKKVCYYEVEDGLGSLARIPCDDT